MGPAGSQGGVQACRQIAREAGRKTAITLSDSFCVDRHRDSFLDLIRNQIDIVFANEAEITSLYQTQDFSAALEARRQDCEIAVLTRSEKGCVVVAGDMVHVVPAHPIEKLVDATGAGDLFASGFLYGLTHGSHSIIARGLAGSRRPKSSPYRCEAGGQSRRTCEEAWVDVNALLLPSWEKRRAEGWPDGGGHSDGGVNLARPLTRPATQPRPSLPRGRGSS